MKHLSTGTLTAFAQNELSESEATLVQQHLRECSECAALRTQLGRFYESLSQVTPPPSSSRFVEKVMERLHKKEERISLLTTWTEFFRSWAAPVFSCVVSVFLIMHGERTLNLPEQSELSTQEEFLPISGNFDTLLVNDSDAEDIL